MKEELQDRAWACVPKEVREFAREQYAKPNVGRYGEGYDDALLALFGHRNLTSDEEPEEILTLPRKRVIEEYEKATADLSRTGNLEYQGRRDMVAELFGKDKCLLDASEERLEQRLEQSVQAEDRPTPKFKVGDKVTMTDEAKISYNGVGTIIEVCNNHGYTFYRIAEYPALFAEEYLEPYTEPEPEETKKKQRRNKEYMEEKELNLPTLLKGAIGETFYCPMWGDTKICSTAVDGYRIEPKDKMSGYLNIGFDGKADEDGQCILFPSRDLYLKYPLEAAKAWKIWAEERKPKRWIPKHGDKVWCLNGSLNPMWGINILPPSKWVDEFNCFQTEELCQQAAEAVKRTLEEFHTNHHNTD